MQTRPASQRHSPTDAGPRSKTPDTPCRETTHPASSKSSPTSSQESTGEAAAAGGKKHRGRARGSLHSSIDQVEVGLVVRAVFRRLPAAGDRVAVVLEPAGEALSEGRALSPERPLTAADAHLVD